MGFTALYINKLQTNSFKVKKSPLETLYRTQFHMAALWGSIVMVRKFCGETVPLAVIIERYREYLEIDDEAIDTQSAIVHFYRMHKVLSHCISDNKSDKSKIFPDVSIRDLQEIEDQIKTYFVKKTSLFDV